jgi:hypothetical protein
LTLRSTEGTLQFPAYKAGYLKNIYMQVTWVGETLKTCDTIADWIEKLCDELKYASCGLMDVHLGERPDATGKLITTLVDYNLTPPKKEAQPFTLVPRKPGSGVTDITLTTDMPKQMAAQAVMGASLSQKKTGGVEGNNLFAKKENDAILGPFTEEKDRIEAVKALQKSGIKNPTKEQIKAEEEKLKADKAAEEKAAAESADEAGFFDSIVNSVVSAVANLFNAPVEAQVKIKNNDGTEWKLSGYAGQGSGWSGDGNSGSSLFPIFKHRDAITNLINGRAADAPAVFDGSSMLTNCEIQIKAIGFGGLKNGYRMQVDGMPFGLKDRGYFQLTTISHSVDNTKWEVTCKAKWRVERVSVG